MAIVIKVRPRGEAKTFSHFGHEAGRVIGRFNPEEHPRDRHGRFITTGGTVRMRDGSIGTVVHDLADGFVEVRRGDGAHVTVPAKSLEVVQPAGRLAGHAVAARNVAGRVRAEPSHQHNTQAQAAAGHLDAAAGHFDAGRKDEGVRELDEAAGLSHSSSQVGNETLQYATRQVRDRAAKAGEPVRDPRAGELAARTRTLAGKVRAAHGEHAAAAARKLDETAAHLDAGMDQDARQASNDAQHALHAHVEATRDYQLTGVTSGREYGKPEAIAAARDLAGEAGQIHGEISEGAMMRHATPGQRAHLARVFAAQAGEGAAAGKLEAAAGHLEAGRGERAAQSLAEAHSALQGTNVGARVGHLHEIVAGDAPGGTPPGELPGSKPGPDRLQDLAGLKLPRNRKLTILHGPDVEAVTGHVVNHDDHVVVHRKRGDTNPKIISHRDIHQIAETAGQAGRPDAVRWERPDAAIEQVHPNYVRGGHVVMTPHPVTGKPSPGTVVDLRYEGRTIHLDMRRSDGSVDTVPHDRSQPLDRIIAGVVPEDFPDETATDPPDDQPPPLIPDPLPGKTLLARPALYTYQRRNLVALGLDADKSQPPAVRQAAALARLRLPMTADQSAALAAAVRAHAGRGDIRPVQARAFGRVAQRLDAATAEVHGSAPPLVEGRAATVATAARDLTEGDTVALAGQDGAFSVVTVRGLSSSMSGRIIVADLEHQDGTRETRTLTGRTSTWLLPDPAPDKPVPPPGPHLEHILPGRLRPGDTFLDNYGTGRTVTRIEPTGYGQLAAGIYYTDRYGEEANVLLRSYDGGPIIVRTARGPGSDDQPWDQVMPAEHPEIGVLPGNLRLGDRIRVSVHGAPITGEIQKIDLVKSKYGDDGREVTVRDDGGRSIPVNVYGDIADRVTRLIRADDNTETRIQAERQARQLLVRAQEIRQTLDGVISDQRKRDLEALRSNWSYDADEVREAIAMVPVEDLMTHDWAISNLARNIIGNTAHDTDPAEKAVRERIGPAVMQIANRVRGNLLASLDEATAGLTDQEQITAARVQVHDQFRDAPPPLDIGQVAHALAVTSAAMQEASGITEPRRPDALQLPDGTDMAARVAAYRKALPAPEQIGHRQVTRGMFAQPALADLEAGRAPAVHPTVMGIPDRAEDGGPGHDAARHLDIIMAAGRDLDTELQRRIGEHLGADRIAADTAARDRVARIRFDLHLPSPEKVRARAEDAHAAEHGFRDFEDLQRQLRAARDRVGGGDEMQRLIRLRSEARMAGSAAHTARKQEQSRLSQEKNDLERSMISDMDRADARRAAALDLLREVRPDGLGGAQARYRPESGNADREYSELLDAARWAEQHYPTDWLQKYRDYTPNGYQLGKIARGHYNDGRREIMFSAGTKQVTSGGKYDSVSVHEEGHAMERAVPGLAALEDAYLWSRVSSGEVGSRTLTELVHLGAGHEAYEKAYKSDFPLQYTGKQYGDAERINPSYEVFTTAVESLFAGSDYLDDGLRQWLLGTMAAI